MIWNIIIVSLERSLLSDALNWTPGVSVIAIQLASGDAIGGGVGSSKQPKAKTGKKGGTGKTVEGVMSANPSVALPVPSLPATNLPVIPRSHSSSTTSIFLRPSNPGRNQVG